MEMADNMLPDGSIQIIQGKIVDRDVECVVNSEIEYQQEGGVCGAIFRAAGRAELQAEYGQIDGCPKGSAVITKGYRLSAKSVIQPLDQPSKENPATAPLKSSCAKVLKVAAEEGIRSIAFSSISTEIYGFTIDQGCPTRRKPCLTRCSETRIPKKLSFAASAQ